MNAAEMKLKDVEAALFSGVPSDDFVAACEADTRAGVQRLAKRYRREQAERARIDALYAYEYAARDEGAKYVAGVDEAGRGPLAGPVVVAAVILPFGLFLPGRVNIYQATMNGMYESILNLDPKPDKVLIDAVELAKLPMPSLSIIKGDAKSASIAAASIIAKVTRDRMMLKYDAEYPQYGFAQHIEALEKYGPCPIHRKSFEPVRSMAEQTPPVSFR